MVTNGTNRNVVPTFLFEFYTHYRPILHRLATMHNAADRAMEIGCLCYSIGGLKLLCSNSMMSNMMSISFVYPQQLVGFLFILQMMNNPPASVAQRPGRFPKNKDTKRLERQLELRQHGYGESFWLRSTLFAISYVVNVIQVIFLDISCINKLIKRFTSNRKHKNIYRNWWFLMD